MRDEPVLEAPTRHFPQQPFEEAAMGKFIDITNHRFGLLVAIRFEGTDRGGRTIWLCQCDCGNSCIRRANDLRTRKNCSCGCNKSVRHGYRRERAHPLYDAWHNMIQRCTNPSNPGYKRYGGRGIKVCDRWKDFTNFLADVGERPSPELSIDRYPDNDGNYEPGNVRWATTQQQRDNQRPAPKRSSPPSPR